MPSVEKLKEVVAEKLCVGIEEIVPEALFVDDLGADSLDLVELIMAIEEEFKIEITDEDSEGLATVQDAIDFLEEKGKLDSS